MTARWAHVTYASFRNSDGRGGWHPGPSISADDADRQLVAEYAPTSLVPTQPFDDFIGSEEIDNLPRRFEYLPLPGRGLFMQSVPAGKDATGRPGNVFTHAVIDREPNLPLSATYPINLYRSPDLRTPFRAARVNNITLDQELAEPRPGPLAELDMAWMVVRDMLGDRRGALHRLQDVLAAGEKLAVLALDNTNEAAYWLQALSSTLSPLEARRVLRFSTFDRGGALPLTTPDPGTYPVLVVPTADREKLARREGVVLVDPADPGTFATQPESTWARLSTAVFDCGWSPQQVVEGLISIEEALREVPGGLRPGDGLAQLVTARPELQQLEVAAQTLGEIAELHRARRLAPGAADNQDLALIRRVVAAPRTAVTGTNWPVVPGDGLTDSDREQLVEDAAAGFIILADAQAKGEEVIAYLDFVLRTRLLQLEHFQHRDFTDAMLRHPALRTSRPAQFRPGSHPRLPDVLDLIEEHNRRRQAPQRAKSPSRQALRLLSKSNPISSIWDWLRQPETIEKLRRLLAEQLIERTRNDHSRDLLRVYYTMNRADPAISAELADLIEELCEVAVNRRVSLGQIEPGQYTTFGREKIAADFPRVFRDQHSWDQAVAVLNRHENPRSLNLDKDAAALYGVVARGTLTGLSNLHRTTGGQQNRKDRT